MNKLREALLKCREEFCWHGNTGKTLSADTYAALVDMVDAALDSPSEAEQRDAVLEEVALEFANQATKMDMCFEQRLLDTVAQRIRGMKRRSRSERPDPPHTDVGFVDRNAPDDIEERK
jgi:hypothetical protein